MRLPRVYYGHTRLAAKHQKLRRVRTSKGSARKEWIFLDRVFAHERLFLPVVPRTFRGGRGDALPAKLSCAICRVSRTRLAKLTEKLRRGDSLGKTRCFPWKTQKSQDTL